MTSTVSNVKTRKRENSAPKGLYSGRDLVSPKNKPNRKYGLLSNGNIEKSNHHKVESSKNLPLVAVSEENVLQQQLDSPTDLEFATLKGVGVAEFLKKREVGSGYGLKSSK